MIWHEGDIERRKSPERYQAEILAKVLVIEHQLETIMQMKRESDNLILKMHQENKDSLHSINVFIEGNGREGAKVRLDRLEQNVVSQQRNAIMQQRMLWGLLTIISGLVLQRGWQIFMRG